MGAGASTVLGDLGHEELAAAVRGIAAPYGAYADIITENAIDGATVLEYDVGGSGISGLLDDLEVKSNLHRKKLSAMFAGLTSAAVKGEGNRRGTIIVEEGTVLEEGVKAVIPQADEEKYAAAMAQKRTLEFDCFLSHKRSDCQDLVARVHDRLCSSCVRAFSERFVAVDHEHELTSRRPASSCSL